MKKLFSNLNEQRVANAFSLQAKVFDEQYSNDGIIQYKRQRVRKHISKWLSRKSNVLELNSGTGEDAIWLAKQGHLVHATDISENMLEILHKKINSSVLKSSISYELCSFTQLNNLYYRGPYDMIFSNFAGLNCTAELDKALRQFSPLLKKGGMVTLVILPPFCLWEFLLIFKGMFATATRRIWARKGAPAKVEGNQFTCFYYHPAYIVDKLRDEFKLLKVEGLCTVVPPSYISHFVEKHPGIFNFLKGRETKLKDKWPWKNIGDYYIISLQKTGANSPG
ncbi:MAG: hypothetical protein JWP81_1276 [Ferruginibacter sp.]|nr:hypothetical protein [Ferruginibacter sp.]